MGAGPTVGSYRDPFYGDRVYQVAAVFEASAMVTRDLSAGWELDAGPVASLIVSSEIYDPYLTGFLGLRHPI